LPEEKKFHLKEKFFGFLISIVYKLLSFTWRFEYSSIPWLESENSFGFDPKKGTWVGQITENPPPVILAHWHEDEWVLIRVFAKSKMKVMVSHSKDGSIMASFLEFLGFQTVRGSSSRGGAGALIALIRKMTGNRYPLCSLAVDGPRGPRHEPKEGIFKLAEKLNAPIFVMAASSDRAWVFKKSWSQAFLPKPFAKIRVHFGGPTMSNSKADILKELLMKVKK
jgi:lysophospholipid acyltransferase (LPLAT)-like uncharacterized protein